MLRRTCWILLLISIATSIFAQTIYWKKDHVYVNGQEVATIAPSPNDSTAPTAPSIISSPTTSTSVTLTWSASTDSGGSFLAGYKVYRQAGSGAILPVGTVGPNTLTFTDQPLRPGIT